MNVKAAWMWRPAASLLFAITLSGCGGGDDGPPRAEVTGTVTLDGKLVEGAGLQFISEGPTGITAYGRSDANGQYVMHFGASRTGAGIGKNRVRITSDDFVTVGDEKFESTEVFPPKYNVKSEEFVEVKEGDNVFDFKCESGGFKPKKPKSTGGT
ncbi:hypothetical protein Pan44_29710 [Caulifigura coniformis]|uniref:Carboxypeptidase regulatory-like domain-containing protein n=1 Tax=Caulifigura coniformis TaxID=2527983 RepID=A0A517SFM7_9PLAN|nr:hypothetical protein [Caulifigura coniformis]QDT54931.1 hypothetical protein Pan44_29710 [Caulifigura coniformis]